jgi:hypothetical protein
MVFKFPCIRVVLEVPLCELDASGDIIEMADEEERK